jgi:hypothetical protein
LWNPTGIGHRGATEPAEHITSTALRPVTEAYAAEDFATALVNVDANRRFGSVKRVALARGRW